MSSGDWKLIEFHEDQRIELYNLKNDLAERVDLARSNLERAESLRGKLHDWLQ